MSNVKDPSNLTRNTTAHPNPMFDYMTGFMPRKLKDLFRWVEYLYFKSPHVFAALQKLSDYVITSIVFDTDNDDLRRDYKRALDSLKAKNVAKTGARDRMLYGNSFISLYFPFKRMLTCGGCDALSAASFVPFTYDWKKLEFKFTCGHCDAETTLPVDKLSDKRATTLKRANIIRWDPKLIDIDYNPITGESVYYYNIPNALKEKIKDGDTDTIASMPAEFLKCVQEKEKLFRFERGKLYHMKIDAPAGVDCAWGFPVLTSVLGQFFYTQSLRKANEAIAMDHLVPFRVLHPAAISSSGDPIEQMSMGLWKSELEKNIKKWRQDPLHMMFSPVALGVTQMGGQGRSLLTLGEIKESEDSIIVGMGIPREFLYGGLSYTGSSVTLRMLENQLLTHTQELVGLLQWVCDAIGDYMGWGRIVVDLTPFKLIDDVQQKSLLLQADAQYQFLSTRTVAEAFDIDPDKEKEQRVQEILARAKSDSEIERKLLQLQQSLAEAAHLRATDGSGLTYDQQAVIGHADQIAQELAQADEGTRRSELSRLQSEDYVMYSVVIQRLEEFDLQMTNEAKASMQQ